MKKNNTGDNLKFLAGGGEMSELILEMDWSQSPLGEIDTWSESLRTTMGLILHSAFPMFLFWGDDLLCFYNDAYRPSLGSDGKHPAIGKKAQEVFPEIWDFIGPLIHRVKTTAKPVSFYDQLIPFYRNGKVEDIYWTFCYSAAYGSDGEVCGVMTTCTETTETVLTKKKLEESERRLRSMITQAPVSIGIFRGSDYVTEIANERSLQMWGRTAEEILDKPILEVMPELKNQGIKELLDEVYTSGNIFVTGEFPIQLLRDGELADTYINFSYEPLFDSAGQIDGIMAVGIEVTDQVMIRKRIEESERRYSSLTQATTAIVWTTNDKGEFVSAQSSWEKYTGQSIDDYWGFGWAKAIHEGDRERIVAEWQSALTEVRLFETQGRLWSERHQAHRYFNVRAVPIIDEKGTIAEWVGTVVDVHVQRMAEEKIKEAEMQSNRERMVLYQSLMNAPASIAILKGETHTYEFANSNYVKLVGKPITIGHTVASIFPELQSQGFLEILDSVFSSGQPFTANEFSVEFDRKGDGVLDTVFLNMAIQPLKNAADEIERLLVHIIDVTEQLAARKQLNANERRFSNILSQSLLAVCILKGEEMIITSANEAIIEIWGKGKNVIGKTLIEVLPELEGQAVPKLLQDVFVTGIPFTTPEIKVMLIRDNKPEECYFNVIYQAYKEMDDEITGITVFATEITEQVIAKKQLEENERKFRLLADSMPQHIWTADPQGNLNYFNQSIYAYSGLGPEEMATSGWMQIVHPDDREENIRKWTEAISTGADFLFEHRFRKYDGSYRWQLSRAKPQLDDEGNVQMWVGTSTDIEEQKNFSVELERQVKERTTALLELNESLRKSEERYHLMVEEVQDYAILYLNKDGIVENWNSGAQKIKGYKSHEILGKSFSKFYTDEDRKSQLPLKLLIKATQVGKAVQEGWRVRKDGSLFWANVVITAVHNEAKEVIGFSKVTHDLTAKKEADDALNDKRIELEQKNAELQRMNKELQSFAYISSHDLQEPLRKIQTFATRIKEKEYDSLSASGKDMFSRMEKSAERMQSLINDLLAYSRTNTSEHIYEAVDLQSVVEKVALDLKEEIEQSAVEILVQNNMEISVIHFQFQQLFYNLISNSIKFAHLDRPLIIKIHAERIDSEMRDTRKLPADIPYIHISVADNGIGFEPEYNERIFELFQRLHGKTEYKGTGIGLSIVKKIVENHQGYVTANGKKGEGATFDIYIPEHRP